MTQARFSTMYLRPGWQEGGPVAKGSLWTITYQGFRPLPGVLQDVRRCAESGLEDTRHRRESLSEPLRREGLGIRSETLVLPASERSNPAEAIRPWDGCPRTSPGIPGAKEVHACSSCCKRDAPGREGCRSLPQAAQVPYPSQVRIGARGCRVVRVARLPSALLVLLLLFSVPSVLSPGAPRSPPDRPPRRLFF